jgi:uncharacterized protein HemY
MVLLAAVAWVVWAAVAWVVIVGGFLIYAAACGFQTFRRVRAAQATIQGRLAVLEGEGLGTLAERSTELNEKMAAMQAALARLERSLAGLSILTSSVGDARKALGILRGILRR